MQHKNNNKSKEINTSKFIRKADTSNKWECGFLVRKNIKKMTYSREVLLLAKTYTEAMDWMEKTP